MSAVDACAFIALRAATAASPADKPLIFISEVATENAAMAALAAGTPQQSGAWLNTLISRGDARGVGVRTPMCADDAHEFAACLATKACASLFDACTRAHTAAIDNERIEMRAAQQAQDTTVKQLLDERALVKTLTAEVATLKREIAAARKATDDANALVDAAVTAPAHRKNGKRSAPAQVDDGCGDDEIVLDSSDRHAAKKTPLSTPTTTAPAKKLIFTDD